MKVLVVDDLFVNRMLLTEIIEQLGHDYDEAENGKEAIEKLGEGGYEFVLMDVEMPIMNGIEATQHIKTEANGLSHVKVIGVTAHDPEEFYSDYKNVQFDSFVTKPYTLEKIQKALNEQK